MRRIPTLLGLFLVVFLIGGMAFLTQLVQKNTNLSSKASKIDFILNPGVANISDTSLVVYWITSEPLQGVVTYGKNVSASDETVPSSVSSSHFVSITNLKPGTKYYFKVSGNTGSPLEATTLVSQASPVVDSVYGKVTQSDGSAKVGAVVVLTLDDSSDGRSFAAITKNDGTYVVPVTSVSLNQSETIVINSESGTSTISCKTGKDHPLPTVQIGEDVNCETATAKNTKLVGFSTPIESPVSASSSGELVVLLENNQTVSTPLPTISGKAGPNQIVTIVVHSDQSYSATIKADAAGNWSWSPPANLSSGQHTATVSVTNADGTIQEITRTFYVSDTSILPTTVGTPAAQLTHSICLNQTCQKVSGAGNDSCQTDTDCAPAVVATHKVCLNQACTALQGSGNDSCATDSDCKPITPVPVETPRTGALETTFIVVAGGLLLLMVGGLFLIR